MKSPPFLEVANDVQRVIAPNLREMSPSCEHRSTDTNAIYRGDSERDQCAICRRDQSREH